MNRLFTILFSLSILTIFSTTLSAYMLFGYYGDWDTYSTGRDYHTSDIPVSEVSGGIYAFAKPTPGTSSTNVASIVFADPGNDADNTGWGSPGLGTMSKFNAVFGSKLHFLSIGGYSSCNPWDQFTPCFTGAANSGNTPEDFANGIVAWLTAPSNPDKTIDPAYNNKPTANYFNGIDIDWEPNSNYFPGVSQDSLVDFAEFLKDLKNDLSANSLTQDYKLSAAMPSSTWNIDALNNATMPDRKTPVLKSISDTLDYMNVMTYDYYVTSAITIPDIQKQGEYTNFDCPLYSDSKSPIQDSYGQQSVKLTLDTYKKYIPTQMNKILIGFPTYGKVYSTKNSPNGVYNVFDTGLGKQPDGYFGTTDAGGTYPYYMFCTNATDYILKYLTPVSLENNGQYVGNYAYGNTLSLPQTGGTTINIQNPWVTYPTVDLVNGEFNLIKSYGLCGMFFWDFWGDRGASPSLIQTASTDLNIK